MTKGYLAVRTTFLFLLGMMASAVAQTSAPEKASTPVSPIAAIEAYCKEVASFMKRNPKQARLFGNVADYGDEPESWRAFSSRKAREAAGTDENLFETADVWLRNGKPVAAQFWFGSPSGDWGQVVIYYFREDGSLAKTEDTVSTFHGNQRIIRTRIYDARGKRLRASSRAYDLDTGRRKSGSYGLIMPPFYRKVRNLPFYRLLGTQGSKK